MNISIETAERDGKVFVDLAGEIDAYTAPQLRESVQRYEEQSGTIMIIDLTEVSYMDSTGLGAFVGIFKALRANDGQLVLTGMSERLKRLFEITGLADVMNINTGVEGGV